MVIPGYTAIQAYSCCKNPEEKTNFVPELKWGQGNEQESHKRSTTISLYRWGSKVTIAEIWLIQVRSDAWVQISQGKPFKLHDSFDIPTYLHHSRRETSPQHAYSDLSFHPQECGCLEALFCQEGTPDGSVMTNVTFPIAYWYTIRKHLHGGVAHTAAGTERAGRRGQKVVSGSQQPGINLQDPFFFSPPVKAETTNNHTFLLPELVSLMNTSLQSLCNVNFLNDQKASKLRKCCILSKRGEGFRGIGNDLLFFKNLGHPLNAVIFKQLVLYICESI